MDPMIYREQAVATAVKASKRWRQSGQWARGRARRKIRKRRKR